MARIGDFIRPELGRTDYSPFLAGAQQGAAFRQRGAEAFAQGISQAGSSIAGAVEDIGEAKKAKSSYLTFLKGLENVVGEDKKPFIESQIEQVEKAPLMQAAAAGQGAAQFINTMFDREDARFGQDLARAQLIQAGNRNMTDAEYKQFLIDDAKARAKREAAVAPFLQDITERETRVKEQGAQTDQILAEASLLQAANRPRTLPPALQEVEKEKGKKVAEWIGGKREVANQNIAKVDEIIDMLESGTLQTGPVQGPRSKWLWGTVGAVTNPNLKTAEKFMNSIDFANLSELFPGQISEGEREAVATMNFDPADTEKQNLRRLRRLKEFMEKKESLMNKMASDVLQPGEFGRGKDSGSGMTEDEWIQLRRRQMENPNQGGSIPPAGNREGGLQYTPPEGLGIPPDPVEETELQSSLPKPLGRYAGTFIEAGAKYGVDPRFLAAIARLETGDGKSSAFRNKNNAMGVSNRSGPISFERVEDSIDRMARVLADPNGPYRGRTTVAEIASVYAPPGASNDPKGTNSYWPRGVAQFMAQLGLPPTAPVIQ